MAQTYARARMLCQQVPDSLQLPQTVEGLVFFHIGQGDYRTAQEIGEHLLHLAKRLDDSIALLDAHSTLGIIALYLGDLEASCVHLAQGIARADRLAHGNLTMTAPWDMGVMCRIGAAWALQQQGYPDQVRQRSQEALTRAQTLASRGELLVQASGQGPDGAARTSSIAAAKTCFQHALEVARHQHAKFWELRVSWICIC